MTKEDLLDKLRYWTGVLRLQDWNLTLDLAHPAQLGEDVLGDCAYYLHRKDANIRLIHPDHLDYVQANFNPGEAADMELTLVHELLHLHLAPFEKVPGPVDYHEQVINVLSRALVAVHRGLTPNPQQRD